jgi:hypothetical protein
MRSCCLRTTTSLPSTSSHYTVLQLPTTGCGGERAPDEPAADSNEHSNEHFNEHNNEEEESASASYSYSDNDDDYNYSGTLS